MINKFLKAKHWQLFSLIIGIPLVFQLMIMMAMFSSILSGGHPDSTILFSYMRLFPLMMILFIGVLFGWFWSIAVGLQYKVPEGVKMNVGRFKIFFFSPLIYIFLFLFFFMIAITGHFFSPSMFAVILPLHIYSIFCIFYMLFFVAKTFKTVELQREVTFSDFAGEFFMIWFYPIGIWIIQPKVNKMVEEKD